MSAAADPLPLADLVALYGHAYGHSLLAALLTVDGWDGGAPHMCGTPAERLLLHRVFAAMAPAGCEIVATHYSASPGFSHDEMQP